MDAVFNDKQTYEVLKRDPTSALQQKTAYTEKSRQYRLSALQQTEV